MSHGLDIWWCLKYGGHSGIFNDENTKTNEWGLCFLHAFSNFLLPDLFLWSLDHKTGGRRSFRIYRGRGYFYMVCSRSIVIPDYAHPQLTHFNKEGWFLQCIAKCSRCGLLTFPYSQKFLWLRASHYADVYLGSAVIKTDDLFSLPPFVASAFFAEFVQ